MRPGHQPVYSFRVRNPESRPHVPVEGVSKRRTGVPRSVCGQLLFGYLADRYGRTRLYGIELVLVIVSTIGVATTSTGYGGMSFLALFAWVSGLPSVCMWVAS